MKFQSVISSQSPLLCFRCSLANKPLLGREEPVTFRALKKRVPFAQRFPAFTVVMSDGLNGRPQEPGTGGSPGKRARTPLTIAASFEHRAADADLPQPSAPKRQRLAPSSTTTERLPIENTIENSPTTRAGTPEVKRDEPAATCTPANAILARAEPTRKRGRPRLPDPLKTLGADSSQQERERAALLAERRRLNRISASRSRERARKRRDEARAAVQALACENQRLKAEYNHLSIMLSASLARQPVASMPVVGWPAHVAPAWSGGMPRVSSLSGPFPSSVGLLPALTPATLATIAMDCAQPLTQPTYSPPATMVQLVDVARSHMEGRHNPLQLGTASAAPEASPDLLSTHVQHAVARGSFTSPVGAAPATIARSVPAGAKPGALV